MTQQISKKDQIKTAIMDFLNKKGHSVSRPEINKEVEKLGSTRTITRALAELKTGGLAIQNKDEATKTYSWVSTEPSNKDLENDYSEVTPDDSNDPQTVETKTDKKQAGSTELPKETKNADTKDSADSDDSSDSKDSAGASDKKGTTKTKSKSEKKREKSQKKGKATKTKKTLKKDDIVKAAKDSKKTGQKKDTKAAGKPKRNPPTSAATSSASKGKKKKGVIATIIKLITKKARTKKQILAGLAKSFPERDPKKMLKTINVQVPSRLRKDKGLNIKKSKKGYKIVSK